MSYLNYDQIYALIERGEVKNVDPKCINAASLDVRLGNEILVEDCTESTRTIDYRKRERLAMRRVELRDSGYIIHPGEFFLAHTIEVCNFSDSTAALFRIKSSMGRIGLEHLDAGFVDPGFNGTLTLEFKNMTNYHPILIRPGDAIGQLVFFQGDAVSPEQSYKTRGNYNGASGVLQVGYRDGSK